MKIHGLIITIQAKTERLKENETNIQIHIQSGFQIYYDVKVRFKT